MNHLKIAHIVPVDLLDMIKDREFYMCLANIACKNEEYLNFFKEQSERGAFVLLDNGAAEGDQMTLDIIWSVVEKIHPSEIVLNDCLLDNKETIKRSIEALNFYRCKGYDGQYMFVPQGKDMKDWINCLKSMDLSYISTIGIPKIVCKAWGNVNSRAHICKWISKWEYKDKFNYHLLGCQYTFKEIARIYSKYPFIRSCDSAIAYVYAATSRHDMYSDLRPKFEINFFESNFDELHRDILYNNMLFFDTYINPDICLDYKKVMINDNAIKKKREL